MIIRHLPQCDATARESIGASENLLSTAQRHSTRSNTDADDPLSVGKSKQVKAGHATAMPHPLLSASLRCKHQLATVEAQKGKLLQPAFRCKQLCDRFKQQRHPTTQLRGAMAETLRAITSTDALKSALQSCSKVCVLQAGQIGSSRSVSSFRSPQAWKHIQLTYALCYVGGSVLLGQLECSMQAHAASAGSFGQAAYRSDFPAGAC